VAERLVDFHIVKLAGNFADCGPSVERKTTRVNYLKVNEAEVAVSLKLEVNTTFTEFRSNDAVEPLGVPEVCLSEELNWYVTFGLTLMNK
jgi:hypothetical protein